ncbi:glutamate ABC transporter substrate-binding protein [Paractinoplanes brasiliensis]|uniref:Amino acid ABC transporter substrate-binding protein (PAAT family) n=1 Tax=Paractinoplanes brasiliensis TaxID=52695 RepID=A0A4R6JA31_9ACTN|nr:glutamate ABC transporter substrate-binding protein [Actinoplanes brasiliensis]TDO31305.1 amino acid ABC transporter substrate-binding protein (PAAT family) [Actinoplanes brasiliensis]GID28373.1 ABC transporter substrate-binding protein [Actinoplanes brasiliensis]
MRIRAVLAVAALAATTALAACSGDTGPLSTTATQPRTDAVGQAPPAAKKAAPACNPRASLRPEPGGLPSPGDMPAGSYMRTIQERGRLVLGTSQDTLLFSSRNPFTGQIEGFDVDMGRQIAEAIFGDPGKLQIKVIAYDKRVSSAADGSVDIVADTMTANCERWQDVLFSSIYYEAGQKVLVSKTSTAKSIEDLGGKKVCSAAGSTSIENVAKVKTKPIPVAKAVFGDCLVAFQRNEVDGISTDDTILAGMAAQDPYAKVIGDRFTDEPYAMAISKEHPEFARFVNAVLERNRADGTWKKTYERWLGDFGAAPSPPKAQYDK